MRILFFIILLTSSLFSAGMSQDALREFVAFAATKARFLGKTMTLNQIDRGIYPFRNDNAAIFAMDNNGTILAHALQPGLKGNNMLPTRDAWGESFFQVLLEKARTDVEGTVTYHIAIPDSDEILPKLIYFERVDEDYFIGSAVQITDENSSSTLPLPQPSFF